MSSSDELLARAREGGFHPDADLRAEIDHAVASTDDPLEIGRLLVAKAISLQGCGDATESAGAAQTAVGPLRAGGDLPAAAFASAMAAVFLDQCGELQNAMEHAVDALIMLGDIEVIGLEAVRSWLALSGFFMRISAFDLAIDVGRRAFDGARRLSDVPIDSVAYSFGYVAAEAAHVTEDDDVRRQHIAAAIDAATWLRNHGGGPVSADLLAGGLLAETQLAQRTLPDREQLAASAALYDDAAPDLIAWHRLVRGSAALLDGDGVEAIELLDLAIPGLEASSDNHCLVRALDQRGRARAERRDFAGAYGDAAHLASLTRRWQLAQVGELADQVARRADLERSSTEWQHTAEQLADDIDSDPTTGVRSRRWLDRLVTEIQLEDGAVWALMFDLDRFKAINDTYGHHIGDQVLGRFGALLQAAADDSTEIARFGGEEFVVIVRDDPGHTDIGTALAEQIRLDTATHDWESIAPGLDLTASCGAAMGMRTDIESLLISADEALLDAKRRGRNRVSTAASEHGVTCATIRDSEDFLTYGAVAADT